MENQTHKNLKTIINAVTTAAIGIGCLWQVGCASINPQTNNTNNQSNNKTMHTQFNKENITRYGYNFNPRHGSFIRTAAGIKTGDIKVTRTHNKKGMEVRIDGTFSEYKNIPAMKLTLNEMDTNNDHNITSKEINKYRTALLKGTTGTTEQTRKNYTFPSRTVKTKVKGIMMNNLEKTLNKLYSIKDTLHTEYGVPKKLINRELNNIITNNKERIVKGVIYKTLNQLDANKDYHISKQEIRNYKTQKN